MEYSPCDWLSADPTLSGRLTPSRTRVSLNLHSSHHQRTMVTGCTIYKIHLSYSFRFPSSISQICNLYHLERLRQQASSATICKSEIRLHQFVGLPLNQAACSHPQSDGQYCVHAIKKCLVTNYLTNTHLARGWRRYFDSGLVLATALIQTWAEFLR